MSRVKEPNSHTDDHREEQPKDGWGDDLPGDDAPATPSDNPIKMVAPDPDHLGWSDDTSGD